MKKLFSLLIILSLVAPAFDGMSSTVTEQGCGGCGCAAMSCCASDADGNGKDAPANVPASQVRVSSPDLALQPFAFFLCAMDDVAIQPTPADRLYRLPKLHVSSLLRNCTFLI